MPTLRPVAVWLATLCLLLGCPATGIADKGTSQVCSVTLGHSAAGGHHGALVVVEEDKNAASDIIIGIEKAAHFRHGTVYVDIGGVGSTSFDVDMAASTAADLTRQVSLVGHLPALKAREFVHDVVLASYLGRKVTVYFTDATFIDFDVSGAEEAVRRLIACRATQNRIP